MHRHIKTRHPGARLCEVRREEEEEAEAPSAAPSEAPSAGSSQTTDSRGRGQATQSRLTQYMSRPITPQLFIQKNLDEQLAKMVVWDLQPFSFVEDRGFKAFTKALNPFYTLPGRKTVSKVLVPRLYATCHAGVKERVGHAAAVCLTTDCWTSRTTQSYMSVTCHFVENYEMVSCLLDCFQFSERHTADNLSGHLLRITREWEIQDKVVACVSDGASNITLAIQKCRWKHLHCFAHTLNLIVRGGLKKLSETVDKVKQIADHFHRSSLSAEKLRATLLQMGQPDLKVLQDCPTRWNSTFYMLKRFVRLRDAIITTLALVNPAVTTLTHDEWAAIEEACEVLQPYEEVTVEISGEGYVFNLLI